MNRVVALLALTSCFALAGCDPTANCPAGSGTGSIVLSISGLPAGVTGRVTLSGATSQTVTSNGAVSGLAAGLWTVVGDTVTQADPRVRTAYAGVSDPARVCVSEGSSTEVEVAYSAIPTSNKIWATNGTGGNGELLGFASSVIATTGSPAATITGNAGAGRDLTFDADGNLWALGPTTADAAINRFPAAGFGTDGAQVPDREINISGMDCGPRVTGLAFAPNGDLWLTSPCLQQVLRIGAAQLAASGTVVPLSTGANIPGAAGLAFDASGNLWVASPDDERIYRYDASQLGAANIGVPSLRIGPRATDTVGDDSLLSPSWLAFDSGGNLWGNNFGGNVVFRIPAGSLAASGVQNVNPAVRITIGVGALLEGMAFDEGGGLWMAGAQGTFIRLGASQLNTSSGSGSPTTPEAIISSADIGYVANVAFYPAASGTPLLHALAE